MMTDYHAHGTCSCGAINIRLSLPDPIGNYQPRQCDCDFCMQRGVNYLSDPKGQLFIDNTKPLTIDQHGSQQAQFLSCSHCDQLVAVIIDCEEGIKGAFNASLLNKTYTLQQAVTVSPKKLSATEKKARWLKLWLTVTLATPLL